MAPAAVWQRAGGFLIGLGVGVADDDIEVPALLAGGSCEPVETRAEGHRGHDPRHRDRDRHDRGAAGRGARIAARPRRAESEPHRWAETGMGDRLTQACPSTREVSTVQAARPGQLYARRRCQRGREE